MIRRPPRSTLDRSSAASDVYKRQFYVLAGGRVKFTQLSAEGPEVILRVIGPGEPFGGVAAFADDATYPVTARAVEPSEAHVWDGANVLALMHRFPVVAINAARVIACLLYTSDAADEL